VLIGAGIREVQAHFCGVFRIDPGDRTIADAFDALLVDGDVIEAGKLRIEVLATPGHTADSLAYRIDGNVFVGDTLFAPDVGTARCDFPGGDAEQLYDGIQRLHALPGDTVLWLCHDYPPQGRDPRASVSVAESRRDNRMLDAGTTREHFVAARKARDAGLPVPALLYPALQVNIRGGALPGADADGKRYLQVPLQVIPPADGIV
jgi:glyoxylase-like metal-dependent hydrolase (beta-lactamase superfamily II)